MNKERERGRKNRKAKVLRLWIRQVPGTVVGFRGSIGDFSGFLKSFQIVAVI
jgi:hypothetical protein